MYHFRNPRLLPLLSISTCKFGVMYSHQYPVCRANKLENDSPITFLHAIVPA